MKILDLFAVKISVISVYINISDSIFAPLFPNSLHTYTLLSYPIHDNFNQGYLKITFDISKEKENILIFWVKCTINNCWLVRKKISLNVTYYNSMSYFYNRKYTYNIVFNILVHKGLMWI